MSPLKFAFLTISFLGIQFGWAIQLAFTTPIFLALGVPQTGISLVWLAGPISGLLVQPIVGAVSDGRSTRWGRRRPFILGGGVCIVIALILISNASLIGNSISHSHHSNTLSIVIAIIGFWILDLANNTVQGPCRALLVDVAPPEQQGLGSAWFSFMLGTGNLIGYFIGSLDLLKIVPFMGDKYRALFTLAVIVLTFCLTITIVTTNEYVDMSKNRAIANPFKSIFRGVVNMPSPVARVCVVQFFSWVGWFTYILFMTTWVGEDIYGGDGNAPVGTPAREAFDKGVSKASLAMTYNAAVTMVFSVVIAKIAQVIGYKLVYCISQLILAACLISTIKITTDVWATVIIAACGIPWTVTMVLPFAIIGQGVSAGESGLYMGVLNIFVVVPQIIVSLIVPVIIKHFKTVAAALVAGGISSVIAAGFSWRLITPKIEEALSEETKPLVAKQFLDESAPSTNYQ